MTIDLTGKVALVTGASRGIGRQIAIRYAGAGALVAANYYRSEEAARELGARLNPDRSMLVRADVGNRNEVREMIGAVVSRFGRIDILVNNAAIFEINRFDSGDYDRWTELWRRTLEVNLFGAANASFLAMESMRLTGGGKIINVASRAAFRGETEFADYGASKAGMVNLTISIARACAGDGITANCIAPGFIETDMAASELEAHREELVAQVPLGRIGDADDVAKVALFLASSLSDYMNGATIEVNGGSWFH